MSSADRTAVQDADFYLLEQTLEPEGRQLLHRVREFMEKSVQPVINHYWTREEFPHDLMGDFRKLGIAGQLYQGYGCPGGGFLLDGMIAMELARVDPSIGTFFGVHGGLAMGSIYLCGSRGAEGTVAARDGADGEDRRLRAHRTRRRLGRGRRPDHHGQARRHRMGPGRAEEVDRERHLRRLRDHLGPFAGGRAGQGVRGGAGHAGLRDLQAERQDRAAGGAERAYHAGRGPGSRGEPAAGGELLQGHRRGAPADPGRGRLAGHRLRPRRLRARAGLRPAAPAVRPPDRGLPAGAGPAGEDAGQHHVVGLPVRAAVRAAAGRLAEDHHSALAKAFCTVRMRETMSAGRANSSAGTASCWRTTWAASSPTPRPSTPTKAPAKSTP